MRFLQVATLSIVAVMSAGVVSVLADRSIPRLEDTLAPRGPAYRGRAPAEVFDATREEVAVARDDADDADACSDSPSPCESDPPTSRRAVTIRGCVVEAGTLTPVANAAVSCAKLLPASPTRTAEDGTFVLEGGIDADEILELTVAATGFVPIERKCANDPQTEAVLPDPFKLIRGGRIEGRVNTPKGIDARQVRLSLNYLEGDNLDDTIANPWTVAADGSFVIDAVVPGAWVALTAWVEGQAKGATLPIEMPLAVDAIVAADVLMIGRASCRIRLGCCGDRTASGCVPPDRCDCVQLKRLDPGEEFCGSSSPEEDGTFLFTDLPAGSYAATLNGSWNWERRRFEGTSLGSLDLAAGEERVVDLARPDDPSVTGEFVAASKLELFHGCCPSRVAIWLERDGVRLIDTVDSHGGHFCFPNVPPGSWRLTASVDCEPLEVEAGQTDLRLREIGHGVVTASVRCRAPIAGVVAKLKCGDGTVTCLSDGWLGRTNAEDAFASFSFESCGPGPLALWIDTPGCFPIAVTTPAPGPTERFDLGTFELQAAEPLRGTVVDDHEAPLVGIEVRSIRPITLDVRGSFDPDVRSTCAATSDSEGRFELPFEAGVARFKLLVGDSETVCVAPRATEPVITLELPPARTIRGIVVTEDGSAYPRVSVCFEPASPDAGRFAPIGRAQTDVNGRFSFTTHATGMVKITGLVAADDLALDVPPFEVPIEGIDLGTLVLRR